MRRMSLALPCLGVIAAPITLNAQAAADSVTAAFHEGQWGVGFVQGSALTEAGALRFSTATRAWVVDAAASFDKQTHPSGGPFGTDINGQLSLVSAQLGPRWYHAASSHLARFVGFGITGAYAHTDLAGASLRDNTWSAGAYGEIGVQYMFTRHLGLGWRATLTGTRTEDRTTDVTGTIPSQLTRDYRLSLQPVQVTGTIYF